MFFFVFSRCCRVLGRPQIILLFVMPSTSAMDVPFENRPTKKKNDKNKISTVLEATFLLSALFLFFNFQVSKKWVPQPLPILSMIFRISGLQPTSSSSFRNGKYHGKFPWLQTHSSLQPSNPGGGAKGTEVDLGDVGGPKTWEIHCGTRRVVNNPCPGSMGRVR